METYSRIGLLRIYGNLQSYWTTANLWKLTVVLDYQINQPFPSQGEVFLRKYFLMFNLRDRSSAFCTPKIGKNTKRRSLREVSQSSPLETSVASQSSPLETSVVFWETEILNSLATNNKTDTEIEIPFKFIDVSHSLRV